MSRDELFFLPDESEEPIVVIQEPWKILIVDDDQEVHTITRLVLSDFNFCGRKLDFFSAYSAAEVMPLFKAHPDIALVFLDVVMEKDDSGLVVCKDIREKLQNTFVRIVLRTGQPGLAPEREIIDHYDINDYKEKTELTSNKLYTTTMTALRSYQALIKIENNRRGLEKIIESSNTLGKIKSLKGFIEGVLIQLTSILELNHDSFYSQLPSFAATKTTNDFKILSATGQYKNYVDHSIDDLEDSTIKNVLHQVIQNRNSLFDDQHTVLFFSTDTGSDHVLLLEGNHPLDTFDVELISIFINNVAIAYDNIFLREESEEIQREIIFGLGELTEVRSNEVGKHVKRMAEYCKLYGELLKFSDQEIDLIYIASTMHDVGKLAIPDAILNKPGRLTLEEFELIKTHSFSGYEMLRKSKRPVMQMASLMALTHHEKYDGTGYPNGLKGAEIDIVGRIAAVADVFDALGTHRVYKKAWPMEDILEYMKANKGVHFDPDLIDLLFENLERFIEISQKFGD